MAKFAEVSYGTHNDGTSKTYTYIVNDNVSAGDILQVRVNHANAMGYTGTQFTTTALTQKTETANTNTEQGRSNIKKVASELQGKGPDGKGKITEALTGGDVGLKRGIYDEQGKLHFGAEKTNADIEKVGGVYTNVSPDEYNITQRVQDTRNANMQMAREMSVSTETFDSYSKGYLTTGR